MEGFFYEFHSVKRSLTNQNEIFVKNRATGVNTIKPKITDGTSVGSDRIFRIAVQNKSGITVYNIK